MRPLTVSLYLAAGQRSHRRHDTRAGGTPGFCLGHPTEPAALALVITGKEARHETR